MGNQAFVLCPFKDGTVVFESSGQMLILIGEQQSSPVITGLCYFKRR